MTRRLDGGRSSHADDTLPEQEIGVLPNMPALPCGYANKPFTFHVPVDVQRSLNAIVTNYARAWQLDDHSLDRASNLSLSAEIRKNEWSLLKSRLLPAIEKEWQLAIPGVAFQDCMEVTDVRLQVYQLKGHTLPFNSARRCKDAISRHMHIRVAAKGNGGCVVWGLSNQRFVLNEWDGIVVMPHIGGVVEWGQDAEAVCALGLVVLVDALDPISRMGVVLPSTMVMLALAGMAIGMVTVDGGLQWWQAFLWW
jgi:hypothetical protein